MVVCRCIVLELINVSRYVRSGRHIIITIVYGSVMQCLWNGTDSCKFGNNGGCFMRYRGDRMLVGKIYDVCKKMTSIIQCVEIKMPQHSNPECCVGLYLEALGYVCILLDVKIWHHLRSLYQSKYIQCFT